MQREEAKARSDAQRKVKGRRGKGGTVGGRGVEKENRGSDKSPVHKHTQAKVELMC